MSRLTKYQEWIEYTNARTDPYTLPNRTYSSLRRSFGVYPEEIWYSLMNWAREYNEKGKITCLALLDSSV